MKTNEIISSAIQMAESIKNAELVSALKKVAEEISGDTLRVVVLGDFKTGKSTLINTLFLKDNLLPVDYLEATAVPTHLSSGETRLQTWLRGEDGKSTLQNEWTDFDQEQVKSIVTADSEEARAAIAEKYSHVCISKPSILPSGITLVDTPGLNTTNQRIYVGTMEEARTAHAILYVVRGRQLSERELSLLADMAGMQQPSLPIHVVVSVPEGDEPRAYRDLQSTIRAQLEGVGIPQCGVSVFVMGSKGSVNVNVDDGWDPFDTSTESPASAAVSTDDITKDLEAFFNGPVRQGRAIRQVRDLRPLLGRLLIALESCVNFAGQNEEKLRELEGDLQTKKGRYTTIVNQMLEEIHEAQKGLEAAVQQGLQAMHDSYVQKVEECATLSDVSNVIDEISEVEVIQPQIEKIVRDAAGDFKLVLMRISNTYGEKMETEMTMDGIMPVELEGLFLNAIKMVPSTLITILDYILSGELIPGGFFTDIIIRFFLGKLPLLKKVLPTAIMANIAKGQLIPQLGEYFAKCSDEITKKIAQRFDAITEQISEKAMQNGGFSEMEHAMQMARSGAVPEEEKARLQEKIALCKQWMAAL